MFDIGFAEFVLVFVIGLLVLGPQRLPKVAAEIGKWVGRARRTANELRRQLEREIELSEMVQPPPAEPPPPPPPEFTSEGGVPQSGAPPVSHTPPPTSEPPAAGPPPAAQPAETAAAQDPAAAAVPHSEPAPTETHSPQPPEPVAHSSKP